MALIPILAGIAEAQGGSADQRVSGLIQDLDDPSAGKSAVAALLRMGESAVPELVEALDASHRYETRDRCTMILYVLGSLRERAAPAARTLMEHLRGTDSVVYSQALWALGEVGPAAERGDPSLKTDFLQKEVTDIVDRDVHGITRAQLELGPDPGVDTLVCCVAIPQADADARCLAQKPSM